MPIEYRGRHRKMWEVFDPRDGQWQYRTYSEARAKTIAEREGLDYNLEGQGW